MPKLSASAPGLPVGAFLPMGAEGVPAGYLECDGSAISRTAYAALFAYMGIIHGQGNGSTTFNLPDTRGKFPRGWAHGSTNDPDKATRTAPTTGAQTGDRVGSVQGGAVGGHTHTAATQGNLTSATTGGGPEKYAGSGNTGTNSGSETRPLNFYAMYCVKY